MADAVHVLDSQGIWEKADKGDWAHHMLTPAKPDGTMRVTTDLSRLNKSSNQHPLGLHFQGHLVFLPPLSSLPFVWTGNYFLTSPQLYHMRP